ncbi:hypothetical protein D3C75_1117990 [compost metagenome]
MPRISNSSSSQRSSWILYSSVRDALDGSVTWTLPPVSFQISQVSMVPKSNSPRSAFSRTPSTSSSSHLILVPEK